MRQSILAMTILLTAFNSVSLSDDGADPQNERPLSRQMIRNHLLQENSVNGRDGSVFQPVVPQVAHEKKSVGLAVIYSLLLPGMGELYAGDFSSGKYFLMGEGALWLTYTGFDIYGSTLKDDARAYAISRAGITPAGKDDQFFIDIGNFMNTDEYNEKRAREREAQRIYDKHAGFGWQWESDAARAAYKDQRLAGEHALNNRKFVVAAVIINHIASAINAARQAIAHNNALNDHAGNLKFNASVLGGFDTPHGIALTIIKEF